MDKAEKATWSIAITAQKEDSFVPLIISYTFRDVGVKKWCQMNMVHSQYRVFVLIYSGLWEIRVVSKSGVKIQNGVWCYLSQGC